MLRKIFHIPGAHPQGRLFAGFALISLIALLAAIGLESLWPALLPGGLLLLWLTIVDFRKVWFLMIAAIPVSTEVELPGGFGTDLPSEPLMWLLSLCGTVWLIQNAPRIDGRVLKHPVSLALLAHLCWLTICTAASQDLFVSVKFLAAKGWYLAVFYAMALHVLQTERDFRMFVWYFFVPMFVVVAITVVRHAAIDFSFENVAYVMGPFFRNHVIYACVTAVFLPFMWYATYRHRRYSAIWWLWVTGILVFLVAINFAYTRAAYIALIAAIGIYWVIRRYWLRGALMAFLVGMVLFAGFVGSRDNWLEFAPNYERTVTHTRFDNLLEATTKLEDISTMERVYRWVAATYMIRDRPYTGFGPGNFYFFYKNYTVTSFKTYVSDNPEHSGMHNYYLMTTVEQGIPGLFFFLLFCAVVMLKGEQVYHRTPNRERRQNLVAALLCFIMIDLLMLMNDFVETDKIGSLFFLSAAVIVAVDLKNKEELTPDISAKEEGL